MVPESRVFKTMAAVHGVQQIERCLRAISEEKGIRVSENFIDYDYLRSGQISESRFFRILSKNLGFNASANQKELLCAKYGSKGEINWRKFVNEIDQTIDVYNLKTHPDEQIRKIRFKECIPIEPIDDSETFRPILSRILQYINYHGITIREAFNCFDSQNARKITENRFFRAFPGPADISHSEICAITKRYAVPFQPGIVDYLAFENDLRALEQAEYHAVHGYPEQIDDRDNHLVTKKECLTPSVQMILDRIGQAVYGRGVRVQDFFIDYDPLRHNEVNESQFKCALNLAVSNEAQLNREDIQKLANFFRSTKNSDKISYKELCRTVDFPFHTLELEKKPLDEPTMPNPGALSRALPQMNDCEEMRVSETLDRLRKKVKNERIPTYAYFRDFEKGSSLTQTVTANQLARILSFLKLHVTTDECQRLAWKFADPRSKNVNYAAFCDAIDPAFTSCAPITVGMMPPPQMPAKPNIGQFVKKIESCDWDAISIPKVVTTSGDDVSFNVLMARIRHLVLVNRIQLKSFFEDYDQLHCGKMSRVHFFRSLATAGMNRISLHDLSPAQMNTIAKEYTMPGNPDTIRWLDFVNDVDLVFTIPELEKHPDTRVPPPEIFLVPHPGTGDWNSATEEMKENYERGMQLFRRKVFERRILLKPDFMAFDKSNRGHITTTNFGQLISMFQIHISKAQSEAIIARYADDFGFNYNAFLDDLEPNSQSALHYEYPKRIERCREIELRGRKVPEMEPIVRDVEGIMQLIKRNVFQRRMRLAEWMRDYDPLKHGIIKRQCFRRALNLAQIILKETELSLLEHNFKSEKDPNLIRWRDFCEEVEKIFATPNLEKDPLKESEEYNAVSEVELNFLPIDLAASADVAIKKLGNLVRQRRCQLTQSFNDFDETHRMTLSQSQFRRCLNTLGLGDSISLKEWNALYAKYRHPLGVVDNINYLAFSDDVYAMAGMQYRTP